MLGSISGYFFTCFWIEFIYVPRDIFYCLLDYDRRSIKLKKFLYKWFHSYWKFCFLSKMLRDIIWYVSEIHCVFPSTCDLNVFLSSFLLPNCSSLRGRNPSMICLIIIYLMYIWAIKSSHSYHTWIPRLYHHVTM